MLLGAVLGLLIATAAVARAYDVRELYNAERPWWMRAPSDPISRAKPQRWPFLRRYFFHLRLRHNLLKPFFVVAGQSPHSRLQLVVVLHNQVAISFGCVSSFYTRSSCFLESTVSAGGIAFLVGLLGTTLGLHLFRLGNARTPWGRPAAANWRLIRQSSFQPEVSICTEVRSRVTCSRVAGCCSG